MSHVGLMSKNLGLSLLHVCARHAELPVDNALCSSCSETPTGLLSTWPLRRANSAGPRRRLAGEQERDRSRPALQRPQFRRRGPQGSGTAANATVGPTKHPYHHVVSWGLLQHLVFCFHFASFYLGS